jgi:hypothetical protein
LLFQGTIVPPHRPHHRPPPHPPHPPRHAPRSAVAALIRPEAIAALLEPYIPDPEDRDFVVRCIAAEGPVHHRGASYALLCLAGLALAAADASPAAAPGQAGAGREPPRRPAEGGVPVPLRLPPHLAARGHDDAHYPLRMPTAALERIAPAGSAEHAALIDCLLDGPPHHALANAALVCLIDALLARIEAKP